MSVQCLGSNGGNDWRPWWGIAQSLCAVCSADDVERPQGGLPEKLGNHALAGHRRIACVPEQGGQNFVNVGAFDVDAVRCTQRGLHLKGCFLDGHVSTPWCAKYVGQNRAFECRRPSDQGPSND